MMRWKLSACIVALLLLVSGCSGGGGGGTASVADSGSGSVSAPDTSSPPTPTTGRTDVLVRFNLLSRAVPTYVDTIRFTGLNVVNDVIYGPFTRNKAGTVALSDVPLEVKAFRMEYLQNGAVRGIGLVPVQLAEGQDYEIIDPPFDDVAAVVASLKAEPSRLSLPAGLSTSINLVAVLNTGEQQELTDGVVWNSEPPQLATVDSNGLVTALAPGSGVVSASYANRRVEIPLTVTEAVLENIVVTPPSLSLASGLSANLEVDGIFSDHTRVPIATGLSFSTTTPGTVSVDSSGQVTALSPGAGEILVEYEGFSQTVQVEITEAVLTELSLDAPSSLPLGAMGRARSFAHYSDQSRVEVTDLGTWESSTANLTVTNSGEKGLLNAVQEGYSSLSFSYMESSISTEIEVTAAELVSLELEPNAVTLPAGLHKCIQVSARYTDGQVVVLDRVAWSSSNPSVAEATSSGQLFVHSPGAAVLTVSWGGKTANLEVTGENKTLETIDLEPVDPTLIIGLERPFKAQGHFDDGSTLDVTDCVFWTVDFPELAHLSRGGVMMAIQRGVVTVTAYSSAGVVKEQIVRLTEADLVEMRVEGPTQPLPVGVLFPIQVTGLFTDGVVRDLTRSVSRLHTRGDLIGFLLGHESHIMLTKAPGTLELTIRYRGQYSTVEETINIEIQDIPLSTLEISPQDLSLPAGLSHEYALKGTYQDGSEFALSHDVTWSVGGGGAYFLNNKLRSTSVGVTGSGTITAVHNLTGQSTQTPYEVVQAFIERVDILRDSVSVPKGEEDYLQAFAFYTNGYVRDLYNLGGWSSTDNRIANLNSNGKINAVGIGQVTVTQAQYGQGGTLITDTATIEVTSAILKEIRVVPENKKLPRGVNFQLSCIGLFSDGTERDVSDQVEWTSHDPKVAEFSILSPGLLKCENVGPVLVEAYHSELNLRSEVNLQIDNRPIASLIFDDGPNKMRTAMDRRFKVLGRTADGELYDISRSLEWTNSNNAVALLSSRTEDFGVLTSLTEGTTTLTAREPLSGLQVTQTVQVVPSLKRKEIDSGEIAQLHITDAGDRIFAILRDELIGFDADQLTELGRVAVTLGFGMDLTSDGNTALVPVGFDEAIQVVDTQTFVIDKILELPTDNFPRGVVIGPFGWAYCCTSQLLYPIRMSDLQVFTDDAVPGNRNGWDMEWIPGTSQFLLAEDHQSPSEITRYSANGSQITFEQESNATRENDALSIHPDGDRFLAIESTIFPGPYGSGGWTTAQGRVDDLDLSAAPLDISDFGEVRYSAQGTVIYFVSRSSNKPYVQVYCTESGELLMTIPLESNRSRSAGRTFAVAPNGRELFIHTEDIFVQDGTALEIYELRHSE